MTFDLESSVRRLLDIEEIKRVTAQYLRYLDSNQWERVRSVFTDDATVWLEPPHPEFDGVDAFIEDLKKHLGGRRVYHHGHMPEIEIYESKKAFAMWSLHTGIEGEPSQWTRERQERIERGEGGGARYYEFDYERVDGRWLISHLGLRTVWVGGNLKPFERIDTFNR